MQRSITPGVHPLAPGASAPHCTSADPVVCNRRRLPDAGRDAQLERWGITPERTGAPHAHSLRGMDPVEYSLREAGGWHFVEPQKGTLRGGGTSSHRGTLQPDEYVDALDLRARVSEHLGFTVDEVRSAYRPGRPTDERRALRARIDARLLEVAGNGGLMAELGRALGWAMKPDGHCRPMDMALARARASREEAA